MLLQQTWQYITDPANTFADHSYGYIQLCIVAIIIATIIGIVIGIAVVRSPIMAFVAVNLSGFMRAIPVIAFLAAALPYLGVGFTPSLIALSILGIPPVLLNTYTGIRGIDPAIIDAARGIGMNGLQIITRIQAPLVMPIIAAGVRTSAVQIVATATLAAIIGAGGYGEYIVNGLYQFNTAEVLAGAIPVSILAMIVEILMSSLQRALTPAGMRLQAANETAKS
ncbi:MAG: ABC transporter permease [Ktedonobacteraceae bacterium]